MTNSLDHQDSKNGWEHFTRQALIFKGMKTDNLRDAKYTDILYVDVILIFLDSRHRNTLYWENDESVHWY